MLNKVTGWCAVLLSLMAFYPSNMTGGLSCIGFYISLFAMFIGAYASSSGKFIYFNLVFITSLLNVLLVNDGTNVFLLSQHSDLVYVLSMYGIFIVVSVVCFGLLRKETLLAELDAIN
ncbi:hypothetical protein C1E23_06195 [Pseudoalteromonas phenolica]|uniref:Uncharacterized protein n=1 Tax=Pseudoalteromonas phenolica TaxID=161398 RepID=A0A4Q7IPJ8_9GAMM|nr:hypothetical protein [Pseudoalteromonas phenolica]RZQ53890.1 hypothetical protein C1E23_06195 [Pseudoalteromonas phenolica]